MLKATKRSQYFEKLLCDSVWPMLKRFFSPSSSFMFRKHRQCLWFLNKSLICTLYFICLYNLIWIKWCWLKLKSLRKERDIGNSVVLRFCKVILSPVKNVLHHFMLIIATASLADVTHPEFHNRHLRKKKIYIEQLNKWITGEWTEESIMYFLFTRNFSEVKMMIKILFLHSWWSAKQCY